MSVSQMPRPESPARAAQRQICAALGLLPGLRAERSSDRQWRCAACKSMQAGRSWQIWVSDSVRKGDAPERVIEEARRSAFNGHGSAWCLGCARALGGPLRAIRHHVESLGFFARIAAIFSHYAIADLGTAEADRIEAARPKWPDTDPIDKSDPHWKSNNNCNINGIPYYKKEVSPGRWQWVVNEESVARQAEYENRKRVLFQSLTTRVVTDDELKEAAAHGYSLNIPLMTPYREEEKSRELCRAFAVQDMLRRSAPPPTP